MESTQDSINANAAREPRIVALRSAVRGLLEPRVGLVFEAMTDHLFNLSASAQLSADGRSQCFEGFATLKAQQKSLVSNMLVEIDAAYGRLVEAESAPGRSEEQAAELNLVDLEEFENSLAIDRIVRAGSERYWVALEAMTLRIAEMIDQPPKRIRLPFGLRGLCTAYRTVIKPLELPSMIVAELDRAFARNLLPEVAAIYKAINEQLLAEGLMPGLEQELETGGSKLDSDSTRAPSPRRDAPQTPANSEPVVPASIAAATQAPLQTAAVAPQPAGQAPYLSDMPTATDPSQGTHDGNHHDNRAGTLQQAQSPTPSYGASELAEAQPRPLAMSSFLESSSPLIAPSPMDQAAAEAGQADYLPGRGSQALNRTVDGGVLERMRSGFGIIDADIEPLPAAELEQRANALADDIAQLRRSGVRAAADGQSLVQQLGLDSLGPEAEALRGSVQMVDNLYQTMIDTLPLSEGMNSSLHTLKLPLAQLSLSDPDFYRNREHPARLLVERLSEVSALAPRNNPRVEKRIEEVLDKVNQNYEGGLEVFDQALTEVTDLALPMLRQQQRNIQRQVAAEEGKEKRTVATRQVEQALVTALPETTLPASVLRLVEALIRDELTLRLLRDGDSEGYRRLLEHISQIGHALLAIAQGGAPLPQQEAERRVADLRSNLDNAQFLTPEQEHVLEQVQSELAGGGLVDLLDSRLGDHELFAEPGFTERLQKLPRLYRWVKRARELELNTWLAETQPDGAVRNLQLIWRNDSATRFAFASEQGHKVRDVDLIELARWLASRLRPLAPSEQLSIIERSVFQTLERKQQDLASVARPDQAGDLTQAELVDQVQSMLRRARRKGIAHSVLAIHTDEPLALIHVQELIEASGIAITAAGQLSPSTRGLVAESDHIEALQQALQGGLSGDEAAGIGIALVDPAQGSAEDLWRMVEETAKRGLALSPNTGVVAQHQTRPTDLAGAVRKTYARLRDDMPPRLSFRGINRYSSQDPSLRETVYQVLLDGSANAGGELAQKSGYHSAALSIALDCAKVNAVCQYAERLLNSGRAVPVFQLRISTDASTHHEFLDFVLNEVSESGIGTDRLCIELRDSARLREETRAADFARTLRSIGCQIAISEVNPGRGSTAQLQTLGPHMLALDASLWPPESVGGNLPALHQTISDLHHLVGEHVVLRDPVDPERANSLGIDFIENIEDQELDPEAVAASLPTLQR